MNCGVPGCVCNRIKERKGNPDLAAALKEIERLRKEIERLREYEFMYKSCSK